MKSSEQKSRTDSREIKKTLKSRSRTSKNEEKMRRRKSAGRRRRMTIKRKSKALNRIEFDFKS